MLMKSGASQTVIMVKIGTSMNGEPLEIMKRMVMMPTIVLDVDVEEVKADNIFCLDIKYWKVNFFLVMKNNNLYKKNSNNCKCFL